MMDNLLSLILIPVFSITLEYAKLMWHIDTEKRFFFFLHTGSIVGLLVISQVQWWILILGILSVWCSDVFMVEKRLKLAIGNCASFLSSWPWQAIAYYTLGWPEMLISIPVGYVAGWIWNKKRPDHWSPSFWARLYP